MVDSSITARSQLPVTINKCFREILPIELNASPCTLDRLLKRVHFFRFGKNTSRVQGDVLLFTKQHNHHIHETITSLYFETFHSLDSVTCSHSWNVNTTKI